MADTMAARVASMTLLDWLDDLTVRFLLNLPPAEMSSMPRLCFQVEEAQWFYEDFVRPANPQLPSLNLRQFCLTLFRHSPLLSGFTEAQHSAAYEEFLAYKVRVPVRGAILMDESMEKVLLVRGWKKGASWSFPRGKINRDEKDLDCAIREVYEETGYDVKAAGLVARNSVQGEVKAIDITMREQHMRLFVFRGVPLSTHFEPRTRREIGKIEWYNVKDLPGFKKSKTQAEPTSTKFYMVAPFLPQLKRWINQQVKKDSAAGRVVHAHKISATDMGFASAVTEDEGETETGYLSGPADYSQIQSADELKRMLSIGSNPLANPALSQPSYQTFPGNAAPKAGTDLLAMLRGHPQPAAPSSPWENATHGAIGVANPLLGGVHHGQPFPPSHSTQASNIVPNFHGINAPEVVTSQQVPYHVHQNLQHSASLHVRPNQNVFQQQSAFSPHNVPPHMHGFSQISPQQVSQPHQHFRLPSNPPLQPQRQENPLLGLFRRQDNGLVPNAVFGLNPAGPPIGSHLPDASIIQSLAQQIPSTPSSHGTGTFADHRTPVPQPRQGQKGVIESGPSVPEASNLPAPSLNAHALKLLDAFKGPGKTAAAGASASKPETKEATRPHEDALLNLFKTAPVGEASKASPAGTDVSKEYHATQQPHELPAPLPSAEAAVSTLSQQSAETLPPVARPVVQSESGEPAKSEQTPKAGRGQDSVNGSHAKPHPSIASTVQNANERPKSRGQLFDPTKEIKPGRMNTHQAKPDVNAQADSNAGQQRQSLKDTRRSAGTPPRQKNAEKVQPAPQFSILQRPGSSAGKASAPQSPLRNDSSRASFQPQVLKRPGSGSGTASVEQLDRSTGSLVADATHDKKDHLLALFGKAPSPATAATAALPADHEKPAKKENQQRDKLLSVFNSKPTSLPTMQTAGTSSAQQIRPEPHQAPLQQSKAPGGKGSQQMLLSLFNNNAQGNTGDKSANPLASNVSPSTPISPFSLGAPVTRFVQPTSQLPGPALDPIGPPRSRLGSMQALQTPTSATPTETKEFLLGYLNGVVKKEAGRNGGRA